MNTWCWKKLKIKVKTMSQFSSLISDRDFSRFNQFLRNGEPGKDFYYLDETLPSLSELFSGENYYAILFKRNPGTEIGHWVTLICIEENSHYEYFDCLGKPPPQVIFDRLKGIGKVNLDFTQRSLMNVNNSICGRWVFCRLLALPSSLKEFLEFFKKLKGHTPDQLVSFLFNIPNPE